MNSIFPDYPNGMNIEWVVNNVCNYNCTYCDPELYSGTSGQPDYDAALDFFKYINDLEDRPILLNLTGGEPTLWPRIIAFLKELPKNIKTQITTNGSRTITWWKRLLRETCPNKVVISVHSDTASIEHIQNLVELLHNKVQLTVLLILKDLVKTKEYYKMLTENNYNCSVFVKPIRDKNGKVIDYNNNEKHLLHQKYSRGRKITDKVPTHLVVDGEQKHYQYALKMIADGENTFKGWKCDLGKTRLAIWHNGDITTAMCSTAMNLKTGNIYERKYSLPIAPVTCQDDYCSCGPDIRIPKWRENVQV